MKVKRFEDLNVWKEARNFVKSLYALILNNEKFKKDYRFKAQISSASISIMSNIAEGFSRKSDAEFRQFLYIAKGSLAEVQSQLYIAHDLLYISKKEFEQYFDQLDKIARMISKLITYLNKGKSNSPKIRSTQ